MTTPINISDREVSNPLGWVVTHGHADPLVSELIFPSKADAEAWAKRNFVARQMELTLIPVTSYTLHSQTTEMSRLRKRAQDLAAKCEELVSERNRYKEQCRMVERDLESRIKEEGNAKLLARMRAGDTKFSTPVSKGDDDGSH